MKCPTCQKPMGLKREDVSFDPSVKPKKKYTRSIYWCKKDDVWITTEIPIIPKKPIA